MAQKYKLIYIAKINDDKHDGMLKIGDTEFVATKPINTYLPNEDVLKKEAEARIRSWSGTAAAGAELVYCEALIRFNTKTQNYETYRDSEVHTVLQHSGYAKQDFDSALDSGREWFKVDIPTVLAAIKATKEYRDYLDTSELPEKQIYDLREEQEEAVKMTRTRFSKKNDMLWHAKMRFGKTITALNLVKQEGYKRTIIITHRPVVEDSWGSDFYHVFSKADKYAFITKIQDSEILLREDETDEAIDRENDAKLSQLVAEDRNFVYFASVQDLRGSKLVGGIFEKNKVVFDIDWDFVIIDEAHEGIKTELGQKVIDLLIKENTKRLDLSGTAYNLFDKYTEKGSVYTWDYVMEQEAKRDWVTKFPTKKNPYEDMPVMHINTFDLAKAIHEKGLDLSDKTFSFREFFRTWTGDLSKDGQPIPDDREEGDFVHESQVRHFLDLLSMNDEKSRFPYVTKDDCIQNAHSLWMVPGVKEAAALSKLLKKHPLFGREEIFGIANVAGEGDKDEDKNYHSALELVRKTIATHPSSITISCGRLTTGVTVKEWTSVFMLSGSETTDAKQYMQTIFRVQSAGKINGVQKKDAYVYDFAPDRTLLVIAATVLGSRKGRGGAVIEDDERHKAFTDFLKFCPVVAIDDAEFKPFGVESLISQINRVQIDRALKTGFTDNGIYDMSKFKALDADDVEKMNAIFSKLKETKSSKPLTSAGMGKNGTKQGGQGKNQTGQNNGKKQTEEEKKSQKELEKLILEKLRTISIRIPLLFYGGDFEIEDGRLGEIITSIDQVSWNVFMPENLTKKDFLELVKYYNQETVIGAGRIIRSDALKADELSPTERVVAITNIFERFHNPSKETVLTPWRVVNMHLTDILGGYCFFNNNFEENTEEYYNRLLEPRYVNNGQVTTQTMGNPDAQILEINSKTGLYPLYAAYSIYRAKLGSKKECEFLPEELLSVWDCAVKQIYVLCQSSMAASITKRTLVGFRDCIVNVKYDEALMKHIRTSIDATAREIKSGTYWYKEDVEMKFDAIIGNPPYNEIVEKDIESSASKQLFPDFIVTSARIGATYCSLITPSRWFVGGEQAGYFPKLRKFLRENNHISKLVHYPDHREVFENVTIPGGVSYFLYEKNYEGQVEFINKRKGIAKTEKRNLFEEGYDMVFADSNLYAIIQKVKRSDFVPFNTIVGEWNSFGIVGRKDILLSVSTDKPFDGAVKLQCAYEEIRYTDISNITKNVDRLKEWKVFTSKGNGGAGTLQDDKAVSIIGKSYVASPMMACTDSLIPVGGFNNKEEAEALCKYMQTKFLRFMVGVLKVSQNIYQNVYKLVPLQKFDSNSDIDWNKSVSEIDKQLYIKYNFTQEEISHIEKKIKEMK